MRTARNFRIGKKEKRNKTREKIREKSVHYCEDRFEPLHWPVNSLYVQRGAVVSEG